MRNILLALVLLAASPAALKNEGLATKLDTYEVREFGCYAGSADAVVRLAMIHLIVKRLTTPSCFSSIGTIVAHRLVDREAVPA